MEKQYQINIGQENLIRSQLVSREGPLKGIYDIAIWIKSPLLFTGRLSLELHLNHRKRKSVIKVKEEIFDNRDMVLLSGTVFLDIKERLTDAYLFLNSTHDHGFSLLDCSIKKISGCKG